MTAPQLRSLGRRTDVMFIRFSGEVTDRGDYLVLRTPSNPTYHWGNYLLFRNPPATGDFERWTAHFEAEFPSRETPSSHKLFTWDDITGELGAAAEFEAKGMRLDRALVLTTQTIKAPPHPNEHIDVRPILTDREWEEVIELQVLNREAQFPEAGYRVFKQQQLNNYRRMSEAGHGHWFGAFINQQLVADLGIFHEEGIARYQSVETHPDFRRQGICGSLVQRASNVLRGEARIGSFVMEADPDYHAARIYESVGFRRVEQNHALQWYPEIRAKGPLDGPQAREDHP